MKKTIAIIGGGSAALSLAAFLDPEKYVVTIYEKNKTVGRKFLVAGKGGFNLTHSEPLSEFKKRYTPESYLSEALSTFTNEDFRKWLNETDIPTFVGTSKRVFPERGIKPITVLNNILEYLESKGVSIQYQYDWQGWDDKGDLVFRKANDDKVEIVKADNKVFALGGGSWKITGSDGSWLNHFSEKGIATKEFRAVNCAYQISWPVDFIDRYEGQPLKNIMAKCRAKFQKGEAVITRFGIEGNAIYGLSPEIETQLLAKGSATIHLDLKPAFSVAEVLQKLETAKEKKISDRLRNTLKLSKIQVALLKALIPKATFENLEELSSSMKNLPLLLQAPAPIDEAISTIGGVDLSAMSAHFELYQLPDTYCIGEMCDWNAPTGGYLLQGCFSMGRWLAGRLNGG